jgi:hypothetical protein
MRPVASVAVFVGAALALAPAGAAHAQVDGTRPAIRRESVERLDSLELATLNAMIASLEGLDKAERAFHAAAGRFSDQLSGLGLEVPVPRPVRLAVLWADSSGWRAVAGHDGLPQAVCSIARGTMANVIALHGDSTPGGVRCHLAGHELSVVGGSGRFPPGTEVKTEDPPKPRCGRVQVSQEGMRAIGPRQRVLLEFMLDTTGHPELRNLRVLRAASFGGAVAALQILDLCTFRPARANGSPISVLVRMPVDLP